MENFSNILDIFKLSKHEDWMTKEFLSFLKKEIMKKDLESLILTIGDCTVPYSKWIKTIDKILEDIENENTHYLFEMEEIREKISSKAILLSAFTGVSRILRFCLLFVLKSMSYTNVKTLQEFHYLYETNLMVKNTFEKLTYTVHYLVFETVLVKGLGGTFVPVTYKESIEFRTKDQIEEFEKIYSRTSKGIEHEFRYFVEDLNIEINNNDGGRSCIIC